MLVIRLHDRQGFLESGAGNKNDARPMMDEASWNRDGRSAIKRLQPLDHYFSALQALVRRLMLLR